MSVHDDGRLWRWECADCNIEGPRRFLTYRGAKRSMLNHRDERKHFEAAGMPVIYRCPRCDENLWSDLWDDHRLYECAAHADGGRDA